MKTIFKYPLGSIGNNRKRMPKGARVIHAGYDPNGALCVWAEVETDNEDVDRFFRLIGTGQPLEDGLKYVGTVQEGPYMWHIYDGGERI